MYKQTNKHMSKTLKGTLALATAFSMLLLPAAGTAMAAGKPGMQNATKGTVRAVVADLVPGVPAKCFTVRVTRSSRSWGVLNQKSPPPRGCPALGDGFAVVKKDRGTWRGIPIANNASCKEISSALRSSGSSRAITRDFMKGYFRC